jgi:hypothetical protein
MHAAALGFTASKLPVYVIQSNHPGNSSMLKCVGRFLVFFHCSTMVKNTWYLVESSVSVDSNMLKCMETCELPGTSDWFTYIVNFDTVKTGTAVCITH